jgi:hypothetical protein
MFVLRTRVLSDASRAPRHTAIHFMKARGTNYFIANLGKAREIQEAINISFGLDWPMHPSLAKLVLRSSMGKLE